MNNFDTIINGEKPVLVDFYADWCGPCKVLAPAIVEVKKRVGDAATIIKMDVDKNPVYANRYGVQSIPTMIIFQKGKIMWRQMGVVPTHEILKNLQPLIPA